MTDEDADEAELAVVLGPDFTEFDVNAVAEKITGWGVKIDRVVPLANAVYGTGPRVLMPRILALPEVRQVRETASFQLPALDPDVPQ